jgi:hypothetical protein
MNNSLFRDALNQLEIAWQVLIDLFGFTGVHLMLTGVLTMSLAMSLTGRFAGGLAMLTGSLATLALATSHRRRYRRIWCAITSGAGRR